MLASARSAGKSQEFMGKTYTIEELKEDSFEGVDIALFSAGGSQTKQFAPAAVKSGCVVVDNSSAYRMDPTCPLIVPEVNPEEAKNHNGIIANPNCSTIIMNVPVWPLHQKYGVDRVVVSTYQAASGAGAAAMAELEQQAADWVSKKPLTQDIFGRQYMFNLFSHNSDIDQDTLYNEEETKMIKETKKIFKDDSINVTATCVRVPVLRAHCESVNLTFKESVTPDQVREVLRSAPGVTVLDDWENNQFPEPIIASEEDDVFVGRIRQDPRCVFFFRFTPFFVLTHTNMYTHHSQPDNKGIEMFIAGDQILKGAALNAVQCAELLI